MQTSDEAPLTFWENVIVWYTLTTATGLTIVVYLSVFHSLRLTRASQLGWLAVGLLVQSIVAFGLSWLFRSVPAKEKHEILPDLPDRRAAHTKQPPKD